MEKSGEPQGEQRTVGVFLAHNELISVCVGTKPEDLFPVRCCRKALKLFGRISGGVKPADRSTDACPDDEMNRDFCAVKHIEDTDMRKSFCSSSGKDEGDTGLFRDERCVHIWLCNHPHRACEAKKTEESGPDCHGRYVA